jgi:hypothetical protein
MLRQSLTQCRKVLSVAAEPFANARRSSTAASTARITHKIRSSLEQGIDSSLFTRPSVAHPLAIFSNTTPFVEELRTSSISISPAMLDKTTRVQEEVVWYCGSGKQIGGKRPPRNDGEGKGKGKGKGQGKGKGDIMAIRISSA